MSVLTLHLFANVEKMNMAAPVAVAHVKPTLCTEKDGVSMLASLLMLSHASSPNLCFKYVVKLLRISPYIFRANEIRENTETRVGSNRC